MSTKQSNEAYLAYESGVSKPKRENKVLNIFGTDRLTINEVIIEHRQRYPNEIRDVSSIIVGLYYAGRLNRDEVNYRLNPDSGRPAAVYFIPEVPLTKIQKLQRRLDKALQDRNNADQKIDALRVELTESIEVALEL